MLLSTFRKEIGVRRWFDNQKFVKMQQFVKETTEDIDAFRFRKIKWAISELKRRGESVTAYKIQLHAGFGGNNSRMRALIK